MAAARAQGATAHSQLGGANSANPAAIFVVTSLEKLVALKEVKKLPKLKDSAATTLNTIKALLDHASESTTSANAASRASATAGVQKILTPDLMRKMFEPLQLACASRSPAIIAVALDCIAKLISYNVLVDNTPYRVPEDDALGDSTPDLSKPLDSPLPQPVSASPKSPQVPPASDAAQTPQRPLIETAVDLVCECNIGESTDEKVHLQVIKALLAAVSSTAVPIHGNVLLKAIRTTWNIFLVSKSPQIQMVAQGSLTQMMTTVYGRAATSSSSSPSAGASHGGLDNPSTSSSSNFLLTSGYSASALRSPGVATASSVGSGSAPQSQVASETASPAIPSIAAPNESPRQSTASRSATPAPTTGIDSPRPTSPSPPPSEPSTAADPGTASIASSTLHRRDSVSFSRDPRATTQDELYARDAYLSFRALCKLATKAEAANATSDVRSTAIQSRVLALQLIYLAIKSFLVIFTKPCFVPTPSSPSGTSESTVLDVVRPHLGLAVGRSLASPVTQVYKAALDVFVAIVLNLRTAMKREIEVFLGDVLLNIMEMKAATPTQKVAILSSLAEIMRKPQALVEIYINYDCNPEALDNIYERMLTCSAKLVSAPMLPAMEAPVPGEATSAEDVHRAALNTLCTALKSLPEWIGTCARRPGSPEHLGAGQGAVGSSVGYPATGAATGSGINGNTSTAGAPAALSSGTQSSAPGAAPATVAGGASGEASMSMSMRFEDDPEALVSRKQQKMVLNEAIQLFNKKPKKGIAFLVERGIVGSKPGEIAHWLHSTEGLNKQELGDYLGDGDQDIITIMHAFVDEIDFTGMTFVDALRHFLQHFRLPGESQKIDRFMLKFAERYYTTNRELADNVFANPDTAYVLAYSVIMLNTDLHNPQVKKRMTKDDFVRNNRGINDGKDLPVEFLHGMFDEIVAHEIKLKDDPLAAAAAKAAVASTAGAVSVSRKARREAFALALEEINSKIEVAFDAAATKRKSVAQRRYAEWITASHAEHVRAMFEATWMANLAALSTVLQKSEDAAQIAQILEAFKHCINVSCAFNLDLERNAFVTTLSNFTLLNNAQEMKEKNFGAIRTLLEVAALQGNAFKKSWLDVLRCVSQLERFHVIAAEDGMGGGGVAGAHQNAVLQQESMSQAIVVATDKIFAGSVKLSGSAIVDFVEALCNVSWDEIPRMYSLTKLVEISYYNMQRIRVEWVNIWAILGQHFNRIGCHGSKDVASFAMDSLRQLSMKFLEKEELSNFKFQREFLRPYEHVVANQPLTDVRDLVVRCIQQMIQARSSALRSGWKAMLSVFTIIARQETSEPLFVLAYDAVKSIMSQHLVAVREYGYFVDVQTTLVAFCKAKLSQRVSLQAVEAIHKSIKVLGDSEKADEVEWFAALQSLYTVVVDCELEVRTRALTYLFTALRDHGSKFSAPFWQRVGDEILFELFAPVTRPGAVPRGEDLSIWLSTTLIQALRQFIDLFSSFYDPLHHKLGDVLHLLQVCILQENETLARLGTSCLQQLMESNAKNLTDEDWDNVCATWGELFQATTATALQDPATVSGSLEEQQAKFQQIIVKCVLQLLLIQTILEVTSVDAVYNRLQSRHLLALVDTLEASYEFARKFNGNLELRTSLWKSGFTKQLPNLLKQETSSVTCLLHILFHMYGDSSLDRMSVLSAVEEKLIPLAVVILETYRDMDPDSRKRNASAWRPVLLTILNGLVLFNDESFQRHIKRFYRLSIDLLMYEVSEEIRTSLHTVLIRTEQFISNSSANGASGHAHPNVPSSGGEEDLDSPFVSPS
ncbi:hypothetical protein BCR44DRAFT_1500063 [Catenaria anguillulae PL171]|uniref:SEC7 domain-containing protein n=1 Tax=Catenaria anguillulae PL171 TaxID=765915 RepID=A0A1Y2HJW1_9FUNG|nr:hypothetical protein BCR44DRAFT_1500063 [Catenaria anguillulae PL171]